MLNKLKARKSQLQAKGGFTLVELIVVLVILAILAALLIPSLTGYINKAKERNVIAECRQVVMAAQTLLDEDYPNSKADITAPDDSYKHFKNSEITKLAEVKGTIVSVTAAKGKITNVVYKSTSDKQCTYNGTDYDFS